MASFNNRRTAHTRPVIAVMPHRPSDIILFPNDSARVPLESHSDIQDNPHGKTDAEQLLKLQNDVVPNLQVGPFRAAVMPHQPSDVILFPHDSWRTPLGLPDIEKLEHVASQPDDCERGNLHGSTTDVEQLQRLLRHEAVSCSPVMRLPPEIFARIFELYVARKGQWTPFSAPVQGPLSPTQVCKHWRAVAESDPHLWTSIHLFFPDARKGREEDVPRVIHMIDLHLKRSSTLPMSFTFADYRGYGPTPTRKLVSLVVSRLGMHSHRWKRISLRMSCGHFPILLALRSCNFPSLKHLSIAGDEFLPTLVPRLNLQSSTNLKSFTYTGCVFAAEEIIDLGWGQLAELSIEFEPHGEINSLSPRRFRYLAQCQNITTFSVGINQPFRSGPRNEQPITLPCLRTLRVRQLHRESHAHTVIDPLILPQLQTLEIDASFHVDWDGWRSSWHDGNFSNLLARSGCTIHHLSIRDVGFPNDELVRCLALSLTLTSFCFLPCPRSQDMADIICGMGVQGLAVPAERRTASWTGHGQEHIRDGPLVPGLREITLGTSNERHLDLMMAMFRSRGSTRARAVGVTALRRVEVVYFDMPHVVFDRPGDHLPERIVSFRRELAQWAPEKEKERENRSGGGERLEASVVIDSPYLVEYIDVD